MKHVMSLSGNRLNLYAAIGLVATCVAVYANSLRNPLLRDDMTAIVNDRRANDSAYWKDIFTRSYWHGLNDDPIYRPLTTLSFLLNRMATGRSPWGFRLFNIMLHAAVCLAVWRVGVPALGDRTAAWLAAMLFAVHAVHTEAVICIVGRADMAVTLFILVVTGLLLRCPEDGRCEPWRAGAIALLSLMAVFTKETAFVILPLVVFIRVWQAWVKNRHTIRTRELRRVFKRDVVVLLAVVAVFAGALAVRYGLFGRLTRPNEWVPVMDNPLGRARPTDRLLTAPVLLGKYLRLLAWPNPLSSDYSYNEIPLVHDPIAPAVLVGLSWLVGVVVVLWRAKRSSDRHAWGVAVWCTGFFFITYSMISNAVVIIGTIFGERLIYLPSVAWCWALGAAGVALARRTGHWGRWGVYGALGVFILLNAGLSVRRNRDWRDPVVLWEQTVQVSPGSSRAWACLSRSLGAVGKWELAIEKMRHAFRIADDYWEDHMVLGDHLARLGRFAEAAQSHRRAYELADRPFKARPAYLLGQCYMELKQDGPAIRAFKAAIDSDPAHTGALNNLAYFLATTSQDSLRDPEAALGYIQRARQIDPRALILADTEVEVQLARNRRDLALEVIRQSLKSGNPRDPQYAALQQRLEALTPTTATAPRTTASTAAATQNARTGRP